MSEEYWREWALSEGQKEGLGKEVLDMFNEFVRNGQLPALAARDALNEWDIPFTPTPIGSSK